MEWDTETDALLKTHEAMAFLRVSRTTLVRLIAAGQLVGYKVGSRWRFRRDDLADCLRTARGPAMSASPDRRKNDA